MRLEEELSDSAADEDEVLRISLTRGSSWGLSWQIYQALWADEDNEGTQEVLERIASNATKEFIFYSF